MADKQFRDLKEAVPKTDIGGKCCQDEVHCQIVSIGRFCDVEMRRIEVVAISKRERHSVLHAKLGPESSTNFSSE